MGSNHRGQSKGAIKVGQAMGEIKGGQARGAINGSNKWEQSMGALAVG